MDGQAQSRMDGQAHQRKMSDGTRKRFPVDNQNDIIKVAAQLGTIDLTASYGVPPGLVETMDKAAQVAIASGLEALKSAGLVSGKSNDPKEWVLPEQYRDSTGVVYASSFPAMDAAVVVDPLEICPGSPGNRSPCSHSRRGGGTSFS